MHKKSTSGVANKINFILTNRCDIIKNVAVLSRVNVNGGHRMVRTETKMDMRKRRNDLIVESPAN